MYNISAARCTFHFTTCICRHILRHETDVLITSACVLQILFMVGKGYLKPDLSQARGDTPKQFKRLIQECIEFDRSKRPLFPQVTQPVPAPRTLFPQVTQPVPAPRPLFPQVTQPVPAPRPLFPQVAAQSYLISPLNCPFY